MKQAIAQVIEGKDLTEAEAVRVMELMLSKDASQAQIASFLTALRIKGETVDELVGFATVLKEKALTISPKCNPYLDLVGTGGDQTYTFNISTTSAFVAAGAGLHIAKHGNRSISSKSGAGDVLESLGVNIMAEPAIVEKCVDEAGIGFMFAQVFNPAMAFVGQARKEMGIRTVFNVLGPLANPSRAEYMMVGVYSLNITEKIAKVMMRMGVKRALVVSGCNNMDEITTTGATQISEIKDSLVHTYEIHPKDFGFQTTTLEELRGGDGDENAQITRRILEGEKGPKRDIVLLNAGAALYTAGIASSIQEGIFLSKESLDQKKALEVLEKLVTLSNSQ